MANIPGSGSISFSDLQADFGDSGSASLSEFYRLGSKVLSTIDGETVNSDVPTSGQISLSNYYNAKGYFFHSISSNTQDIDLVSVLQTAGWNGIQPVYLTVDSDVYAYGLAKATTMAPGIKIENNSSKPYYITVRNKGYIYGAGGTDFGSGYAPTEAINCSGSDEVHLIIRNDTWINGGGGAGMQITRQLGSVFPQYVGGAGGGAGGGRGDVLKRYSSFSSVSNQAGSASGTTGATGREGDEGQGSDTSSSTTVNEYPLTGGAAGGAGGGLYNGIRVGGAQGGSIAYVASLPTVLGTWSSYSSTIDLASGGVNDSAGGDGPISSFDSDAYASGAFGAGAGGGWGANGGGGWQWLSSGAPYLAVGSYAPHLGAAAIKNTSTGGSTTIDTNYDGTIFGDIE